jgi:hypothetical protein
VLLEGWRMFRWQLVALDITEKVYAPPATAGGAATTT